jgi:hypothetical protein
VRLPSLFIAVGTRRGLLLLGAATALFGLAMLPAIATMASHGASVVAFETAGSVGRSEEILREWGTAGERAMWWQLALDTPFVVSYGLLLAGACAAVARRAETQGKWKMARAAIVFAWLGAIAAIADLSQNASLAIVLADAPAQPWCRISALAVPVTLGFGGAAACFALAGFAATRGRAEP